MAFNDRRPKISLALTHFNRFDLLTESFAQVLEDPRIGEVVISDDASTDGSWERLQNRYRSHARVKLFRNERNLDCYRNKAQAVRRCTEQWVILFDSDNVLTPAYLDTLDLHYRWNPRVVYCPTFAQPNFDYRAFDGLMVDKQTVAEHMDKPMFSTALNTCNYFVHRENFLESWDGSLNPHTADSIYQMWCWFSRGHSAYFVSHLHYYHRVHAGSHYKQNHHKTGSFAKTIEERLRKMK